MAGARLFGTIRLTAFRTEIGITRMEPLQNMNRFLEDYGEIVLLGDISLVKTGAGHEPQGVHA
jgi:hypothetical protein